MAQTSYTATPGQYASAAMHLELRSEWAYVRINGERYVSMTSGTSGHVYLLRADGRGCACTYYETTGKLCSHALALELATMEDELRETASVPSLASYRDLFPGCAGGCGELVDDGGSYSKLCYRCSAEQTFRLEQQSKRERMTR